MKNLKELQEKYSKHFNGLGHVKWGGKSFYEINSDKPLSLNSVGGKDGFILNELGQVQCYEILEADYKFFISEKEITEDEYYKYVEEAGYDSEKEEELGLKIENNNIREWWGLTLDNYYPWPYYPDKEIIAFEIVSNLPYFYEGVIYNVEEEVIRSTENYELAYVVWECLEHPEFFRPIYKNN